MAMLIDYGSICRSLGFKERDILVLDPNDLDPEEILFIGLSINEVQSLSWKE